MAEVASVAGKSGLKERADFLTGSDMASGGGVWRPELLTWRSKKDLKANKIDVYRFGSVTTPYPWPAPRA
ncbi:MAG: hypothetical protein QMB98_01745, partial [Flaviflexus sp.]|uniref:hypothetical protein n=1 Tax=Flaviflexus sp. TaxID=1969482 RepID=UPI00352BF133